MSTDYQANRVLSDIQGKLASIEFHLGKSVAPRAGRAFFALATASVLRLRGEIDRAEFLEQRSVASPAMTSVAGWASEIASSPVGSLLVALVKASAYAGLATRATMITLDAEQPKLAVGGEIGAAFVAEGSPVAITKSTLTAMTLTPKKIMALCTVSEEMLNLGINIEASLRTLMTAGISATLDSVFFGTAAASTAQPAGILNGVSATIASASTIPSEAALADIRALIGALTTPLDVVFVAAPPRAAYLQASLGAAGIPVLASAALPAARLIAVDAGGLITGSSPSPRFASSREAALHEDSSVLPLSATGSPNTVAAPLRSLLQTDIVAIRAVFHVAWAIRAGAVSWLDATAW